MMMINLNGKIQILIKMAQKLKLFSQIKIEASLEEIDLILY
jgi:hypothetical protein